MCASYGIDLVAETGPAPRVSRVRFGPMPELEAPGNRERIEAWAASEGGRARITGRIARNLNPLIRARRGARELAFGWWWLHVNGRPAEYSAFNSRDDRLLASWREPFQRRVLLPATWYVEKGRVFGLPEGEAFGIAAITATVPQPDGGELVTYSMVTRDAVGAAAETHPRMPLILPREFHDEWLDESRAGDAGLVASAKRASERLAAVVRLVSRDGSKAAPPAQPVLF